MGSQIWQMSIWICLWSLSSLIFVNASSRGGSINGHSTEEGSVWIDGKTAIGEIDEDFICATLDWWPPEKCDYGTCAWGNASLLNLDLDNQLLLNAVRAFSPMKLRLGGTLQNKVIYESQNVKECNQFTKSSELFGFTNGCLPLKRWDELNDFFSKSGAVVIFGLNALSGKTLQSSGSAVGDWDSSNAESLIRYTFEKGYDIRGWELGNELSGNGVGTKIAADQYSSDVIHLSNVLQDIYKDTKSKPLVVAPGGFFDANWFREFVHKTPSLDVATHHIYNLGPGVDEHLVDKILNPSVLDGVANTFRDLQNLLKSSKTSAVAWVGEAGGAYNSGRNHVTNTFIFSFWYLDQLGMSASYDTKTYCRQSLIGGNYGLLDTTTFEPNPDYYSALLWHRLMGRKVLSARFSGLNTTRAYAHCAKQSQGIVLLLINLNSDTTIQAKVNFNSTSTYPLHTYKHHHRWAKKHHHNSKHRSMSKRYRHWYNKAEAEEAIREEYHLTAKDGDLASREMLLNGETLTIDSDEKIPDFQPVNVNHSEPIIVDPYSIVFVHFPHIVLPACGQ